MSSGERVPLAVAQVEAGRIATVLDHSGLFDRIAVAGSVRRRKPEVRDLEIVARYAEPDRFGLYALVTSTLHAAGLRRAPPVDSRSAPWGRKYRKCDVLLATPQGGRHLTVDLFLVSPPARWGPVFAIRTGSAEFSQFVVTRLHAYDLRTLEGRVVRGMKPTDPPVDLPVSPEDSEEEFFAAAHLRTPPPERREVPVAAEFLV